MQQVPTTMVGVEQWGGVGVDNRERVFFFEATAAAADDALRRQVDEQVRSQHVGRECQCCAAARGGGGEVMSCECSTYHV